MTDPVPSGTPSNSTLASVGIGIPAATVLSWTFSLWGITMPGPVEAAIGALISAGAGYLFTGGRKVDTQ
jgi:membrane protease YdiL (CAAX protease family)